jgi:hypothetical protein
LDVPSASPFAVAFFTLPKHWELQRDLSGTKLGANALRDGDFETATKRPEFIPVSRDDKKAPKNYGAPVTSLANWTVQQQTLDAVDLDSRIIPSWIAEVKKKDPPKKKKARYDPSNGMGTEPFDPPEPELGDGVLMLQIRPKVVLSPKDNKPYPAPVALERTYLAVNSPAVHLQPGTWVRISAWVRIPGPIQASADGALLFDNAGGDSLGLRFTDGMGWKQFHLYRKVPASGMIWVTAAMTGIGTMYVDNVKIEPLVK